ncbi:hypothetical protein PENTCL1PPCAC_17622, partial [Pristionchus entomophagus]
SSSILISFIHIFLQYFMVFQVTSELGEVTLISIHRFIAACLPVSNLKRRIDNSPRIIVTLFHLFLSSPLLIPFLIAKSACHYFEPYNTGVQLYTTHHAIIQSTILGLFCLTSTLISFFSYYFVFLRVFRFSRRKGRVNSQELKTTSPAYIFFPTFILSITNPWCLILSGTLKPSKKNGGYTANPFSTFKTIWAAQSR